MDTTFKSESGIKLLVGTTVITIMPANGAAKRPYRKRKPRPSTGRPVGRPRKAVETLG